MELQSVDDSPAEGWLLKHKYSLLENQYCSKCSTNRQKFPRRTWELKHTPCPSGIIWAANASVGCDWLAVRSQFSFAYVASSTVLLCWQSPEIPSLNYGWVVITSSWKHMVPPSPQSACWELFVEKFISCKQCLISSWKNLSQPKQQGFPSVENSAFSMAGKQSQLHMGQHKHPAAKKMLGQNTWGPMYGAFQYKELYWNQLIWTLWQTPECQIWDRCL